MDPRRAEHTTDRILNTEMRSDSVSISSISAYTYKIVIFRWKQSKCFQTLGLSNFTLLASHSLLKCRQNGSQLGLQSVHFLPSERPHLCPPRQPAITSYPLAIWAYPRMRTASLCCPGWKPSCLWAQSLLPPRGEADRHPRGPADGDEATGARRWGVNLSLDEPASSDTVVWNEGCNTDEPQSANL